MFGAVFGRNQRSQIGIVRILVPFVVVAEILPGVVRRVGQDQVDLAAVLVERHHRLEVLAFQDEVPGLHVLRPAAEPRLDLLAARLHSADDAPGGSLSFVAQAQAARLVGVPLTQEANQLVLAVHVIGARVRHFPARCVFPS